MDPNNRFITPEHLNTWLDKTWGNDWRDWEGATLWAELGRSHVTATDELVDKIRALQTLYINDAFFYDPVAFEKMVIALNGLHVDTWSIQGCSPGEIAYALTTTKALRGDRKFTEPVIEYIRACFVEDGTACYPDVLKFAEPAYTGPMADLCAAVRAHPWKEGEPVHANPVAVQAWKSAAVDAYVKERLAQDTPVAA